MKEAGHGIVASGIVKTVELKQEGLGVSWMWEVREEGKRWGGCLSCPFLLTLNTQFSPGGAVFGRFSACMGLAMGVRAGAKPPFVLLPIAAEGSQILRPLSMPPVTLTFKPWPRTVGSVFTCMTVKSYLDRGLWKEPRGMGTLCLVHVPLPHFSKLQDDFIYYLYEQFFSNI